MNESTGIRGRGVRDGEEARKEAVGPLNTLTPTPVYPQWGCWGAPFPYTSTIFCEENRVDMNHIGLEVNTIERV